MASYFPSDFNYSWYTIPAAWVVALLPRVYARALYQSKSSKSYDAVQPRNFLSDAAADQSIDRATKDAIVRAVGAHTNGFEGIGLFAAAVLAGNFAKLDNATLNALTVGYVISRVAYNLVYMFGADKFWSSMRSLVYMAGSGLVLGTFVIAGRNQA